MVLLAFFLHRWLLQPDRRAAARRQRLTLLPVRRLTLRERRPALRARRIALRERRPPLRRALRARRRALRARRRRRPNRRRTPLPTRRAAPRAARPTPRAARPTPRTARRTMPPRLRRTGAETDTRALRGCDTATGETREFRTGSARATLRLRRRRASVVTLISTTQRSSTLTDSISVKGAVSTERERKKKKQKQLAGTRAPRKDFPHDLLDRLMAVNPRATAHRTKRRGKKKKKKKHDGKSRGRCSLLALLWTLAHNQCRQAHRTFCFVVFGVPVHLSA